MRIGIDARFYGSVGKGLGRYTEKLIEQLEIIDTDNDYVVFLRQENFDEYVPKNRRFKKVLAQYAWYSFSEQFLFPFRLLSFHLDLVHFPHFNVPFLYPKRFVVTLHDLILLHYPTRKSTTHWAVFYWMKFIAYRFVIASAIWRAAHVITVSHFTEEDILARYPMAREKISVTYEAADSACLFLSLKQATQILGKIGLLRGVSTDIPMTNLRDILKPYLLYAGNAYPHKNLEALLQIAPLFPAYQFVLVGKEDYFYRRLKKRVREEKLQNVIFTGFVSDRELSILYRFATCYIFPSLYEGFGLPPLEAMAHGLPVLSSDCGSLPEILGNAAHYFDPHVQGSFEKKLAEMLRLETVRQECILRGYTQVHRYSWERMAFETKKLYLSRVKNND